MERMPEKIDSKFRYVLVAARRAEQLMQGARPRVDLPGAKYTRIAMTEIQQNLVDWDYGPPPESKPEVAEGVEEGDAQA